MAAAAMAAIMMAVVMWQIAMEVKPLSFHARELEVVWVEGAALLLLPLLLRAG